jgi:RNA polymerase sigma factor (sigma-70 family)
MHNKTGYPVHNLHQKSYEKYPQYNNNDFLKLSEYEDIAKRIIAKYIGKSNQYLLYSEDAISYVMECVMFGEWKYNAEMGKTRYTFRNQNGIYAVKSWLSDINKTQNLTERGLKLVRSKGLRPDEVAQSNETEQQIHNTLETLTERQRQYYRLKYVEIYSPQEIIEKLKISRQRCSQLDKQVMKKVFQCPNLRKT